VVATSQVFLILMGAFLFGRFIALSGLGNRLVQLIETAGLAPIAVMVVIVVIYLVLGTFLEGMSALVITVPIFAPVVAGLGYDLIWFGVIVVKLIEISVITPPLGFNVLVLKGAVPDIDISAVWRRVIIFVLIDLVIVGLLFTFPDIILYLPSRM
jgi:TRAP-type C4-dicarboxylate transport system permease large subunit